MNERLKELLKELEAIKQQARQAIADSREEQEQAKSLIRIIKSVYKEV